MPAACCLNKHLFAWNNLIPTNQRKPYFKKKKQRKLTHKNVLLCALWDGKIFVQTRKQINGRHYHWSSKRCSGITLILHQLLSGWNMNCQMRAGLTSEGQQPAVVSDVLWSLTIYRSNQREEFFFWMSCRTIVSNVSVLSLTLIAGRRLSAAFGSCGVT